MLMTNAENASVVVERQKKHLANAENMLVLDSLQCCAMQFIENGNSSICREIIL